MTNLFISAAMAMRTPIMYIMRSVYGLANETPRGSTRVRKAARRIQEAELFDDIFGYVDMLPVIEGNAVHLRL